jgi:hypothetical protein
MGAVQLPERLAPRTFFERRRSRAEADTWIARLRERDLPQDFDWRIAELTCPRERRALGTSIRKIVPGVSAERLPGASPLNRVALRPHGAALAALADRLDDLERPVSARGILAVRGLLTDPDGALYARGGAGSPAPDVAAALAVVTAALEIA